MQGGAVQGIGWALNEEYLYNDEGALENPGFLDYRIPVASDLPFIDAVIVEVPNPLHPFGVKGRRGGADCAAHAGHRRGGLSVYRRAVQRFAAQPTQDRGGAAR